MWNGRELEFKSKKRNTQKNRVQNLERELKKKGRGGGFREATQQVPIQDIYQVFQVFNAK